MNKVNYEKYKSAWSHLCSAREELESVQVGTDRVLYAKIDLLVTAIGEAGKLLDASLIRPEEDIDGLYPNCEPIGQLQ